MVNSVSTIRVGKAEPGCGCEPVRTHPVVQPVSAPFRDVANGNVPVNFPFRYHVPFGSVVTVEAGHLVVRNFEHVGC